ncbi:diphthamide biosynthesis protein [Thozetella sp. PMI_491]|nr:diphthamide biosynthesis protein [Thozetella sp. PMI_491]
MSTELSAAPVLSTPAEYLLEQHVQVDTNEAVDLTGAPERSDQALAEVYEISRSAGELRDGGWRTIALQFPDAMLRDAPRVVELLRQELSRLDSAVAEGEGTSGAKTGKSRRIYILADTSYSSCCVDEIAAEHVNADVVVHYGRSCLSPTSRLPVVYVFTKHHLDHDTVAAAFEKEFPDKQTKVVLMADVTRQDHVLSLASELIGRGYEQLLSTAVVHDPTATLPNRRLVDAQGKELPSDSVVGTNLQEYSVFHISDPPTSLLLALSSRVQALHILPTSVTSGAAATGSSAQTTRRLLGRRYARLLSVASAGTIGILVNTLSVANYLTSLDNIRAHISAAGKKSYTVVVGKLNPAKLANFAEVDGWVVVGCWESSLVEDDGRFFKPVITPFELEAALIGDDKRVWGGEWWGGIEGIKAPEAISPDASGPPAEESTEKLGDDLDPGDIDDEESEPPEFDLRTGKLISHSRPMRAAAATKKQHASTSTTDGTSSSLALRPKAELATVNGVVSPGAEYLRSQRTWQGLGTDFASTEASTAIEEGRGGVARGYAIGDGGERR